MAWSTLDETTDASQSAAVHIGYHDQLHTWANDWETDLEVRYVSTAGDDTNDGYTWATAKATGESAYDSLPARGGTRDWNYGKIVYGRGVFTEPVWPIGKLGDSLVVKGQGAGIHDNPPGTVVQPSDVAGNNAKPFLAYAADSGSDVFHHNVIIADMTIKGGANGSTNLTTAYDGLVQMRSAGTNCIISNVFVADAAATGFYIARAAETLTIINPYCVRMADGYMVVKDAVGEIGGAYLPQGIWVFGGQFDQVGAQDLTYDWFTLESNGTTPNKTFAIYGATFEAGTADCRSAVMHSPIAGEGWQDLA